MGLRTIVVRIVLYGFAGGSLLVSAPLTVGDIASLLKAKVAESVIIAKAKREAKSIDLSVEDILLLKKAGATDTLIQGLLEVGPASQLTPVATVQNPTVPVTQTAVVSSAGSVVVAAGNAPLPPPSGATTGTGSSASVDPDDPMAPHDSGIYVVIPDRDGKKRMVMLERAAYQGAKTGGMFASAMTAGIKKAKMLAVIPGPRASIRLMDAQPTFYFYFDDKAAGLGKTNFGLNALSNPNQFVLLKLEVKKSNRQTIIGEVGAFGASMGSHEKSMVPFRSERIRSGLYRVTLTEPLGAGEFAFMASSGPAPGPMNSGAAAAVEMFDFGTAGEY